MIKKIIYSLFIISIILFCTGFTADATTESTQGTASEIVDFAKEYLGYSYAYGGAGPNYFDCSGFVQYVFNNNGYAISRTCDLQAFDGEQISLIDLELGDIVVFGNTYCSGKYTHCGIYIGNNEFIHAANSRKGVIISSLTDCYYSNRFTCGVRICKQESTQIIQETLKQIKLIQIDKSYNILQITLTEK